MRTLVYPYDEDFEAVIKYGDFIETMEIREILSPVGWGLQNKKVGENIPIKTNINAVNWERIDALLLIDTIRTNLHINEILEVYEDSNIIYSEMKDDLKPFFYNKGRMAVYLNFTY